MTRFHPEGSHREIEEAAQRLGRALTESEIIVLGMGLGFAVREYETMTEATGRLAADERRETLASVERAIHGERALLVRRLPEGHYRAMIVAAAYPSMDLAGALGPTFAEALLGLGRFLKREPLS